ncbi:hypothetical protein ACOTDF_15710 [Achromobacter insuavis]|uniref:hypothetical protein n=1 Tax=Achromobacter insuavis TaxID=1287735 RepID=UPI003B9992A7
MPQSTHALIQNFSESLLSRLSEIFVAYGGSSSSFNSLVTPLRNDPDLNPQQLHDRLHREDVTQSLSLRDLFEVGAAFALRAQRHLTNQDHTLAWIDISSSQYWVGVIAGTQLAVGAGELALSERSRKGSVARTAKYQFLKDRARELVEAGNYKSRRNAALSIKDDLIKLARSQGVGLSADQAERTITKWLTDMKLPLRTKK